MFDPHKPVNAGDVFIVGLFMLAAGFLAGVLACAGATLGGGGAL